MVKGGFTPSDQRPLVKDANVELPSGMFSYSIIVGMFLYLSYHTRPDISFTDNCFAHYMFSPKRSHELSLKRLAQYLKNNQDRGLVLDPNSDIFKVDASGFVGIQGHENPNYLSCTKSRTGLIIIFADCTFLCISKLQNETALYKMEAQIIAFARFC